MTRRIFNISLALGIFILCSFAPKQTVVTYEMFTPNGDAQNDTWEIDNINSFPNASVTIFNRWGTPVYKSVGTYIPWDGMHNGKDCPVGSYFYVIDLGDGSKELTGKVTLLR